MMTRVFGAWTRLLVYAVVGCLMLVNAAVLVGQDDAQEERRERRRERTQEREIEIVVEAEDGDDVRVVELRPQSAGYWIGGRFAPISEFPVVSTQLGVDSGVVALMLVEDGPAAKGGLKEHDILLTYGGDEIKSVDSLVKKIAEIKETETEAVVLRRGKKLAMSITPSKRPKNSAVAGPEIHRFRQRIDEFRKQLEGKGGEGKGLILKFETDDGGEGAVRMLRIEPRVLLGKRLGAGKLDLPKGLSIKVEKNGDEPAKIHVKSEDGEWSVTEDDLKELPETVRQYVEDFMGDTEIDIDGNAISERVLEAVRRQLGRHGDGENWTQRVQDILESVESGFDEVDVDEDTTENVEEEIKRLRREVEELRKRQQRDDEE